MKNKQQAQQNNTFKTNKYTFPSLRVKEKALSTFTSEPQGIEWYPH